MRRPLSPLSLLGHLPGGISGGINAGPTSAHLREQMLLLRAFGAAGPVEGTPKTASAEARRDDGPKPEERKK